MDASPRGHSAQGSSRQEHNRRFPTHSPPLWGEPGSSVPFPFPLKIFYVNFLSLISKVTRLLQNILEVYVSQEKKIKFAHHPLTWRDHFNVLVMVSGKRVAQSRGPGPGVIRSAPTSGSFTG